MILFKAIFCLSLIFIWILLVLGILFAGLKLVINASDAAEMFFGFGCIAFSLMIFSGPFLENESKK
jgi:hypothetical protein